MSTITESIGRVLAGRYRIESALGSGASANVFAAFDTTLQRRVAVKVLHPALAADGGFLRRFRAEAQAAAALANAHVLAVHDWGEDAQGPFLVLEFLGGGSLRDMLDEGTRLSLSQAVSVGAQAAEGLAYAHARGFVHRDVKPANLLFDEEGRLRIADFGLARALAEAALTEPAGTTVGTARYAAPEQALGHRVDGRADVYSLALVLYEAVTGVVPFTSDTTIATLMARVGASLPGHDGLGPLAAVLSEAATPEAEDRLDAAALATRLHELAEELPDPAWWFPRPRRADEARVGGTTLTCSPSPLP
jgi:serine/threonine protein kinase